MKTSTRILTGAALLVAAFSPSFGQTAKTKPVGYRTEVVKAGVFNLLSPNLDNAVEAAGTFEAISGTTLTDNDAAFSLTAGQPYTLKITSGPAAGTVADIVSSTATTVTTEQDISSILTPGVSYEIRKTPTIGSLFGENNSAGLKAGSATTADIIWVWNGTEYVQIYYADNLPLIGTGWRQVAGGATDRTNTPVSITDAIFIQRRGETDLSLVFTGHVQTTPTKTVAVSGFTPISRVIPVGLKLSDSKLENEITQGSATTGDVIWNPDGNGDYNQYYYANNLPLIGTGWRQVAGGATDRGDVELASGFLIQRKGADTNVTLQIPAGLDL